MNWGLTIPTLLHRLKQGYVKAAFSGRAATKVTIYYLTSGVIKSIQEGDIDVIGTESSGEVIVQYANGKKTNPTTQWAFDSHNAQSHGSDLIRALLPNRDFPYPKSLYAVEDVLRILCGEKTDATVLDFFAGSGSTAHAVMRLNKQDNGMRQCISITNNEVAANEQRSMHEQNLRPGDPGWEKWGICDYITKPRIKAAITGKTPDGEPVNGDYKFTDQFPMAEGFEENAEFFTLTYETPVSISHNRAFTRIAPLLWMKAGCEGPRIDVLPKAGWEVADTYGLLSDLDVAAPFLEVIKTKMAIRMAFIVTDDDRRFQSVAQSLPDSVEAIRLYESYLTNFRFSMGR